jgi:hypothetical protein
MGMKLAVAQMLSGVVSGVSVANGAGDLEKIGAWVRACAMGIAGRKDGIGAVVSAGVTLEASPGGVFPWAAQAAQKSSNTHSGSTHLDMEQL